MARMLRSSSLIATVLVASTLALAAATITGDTMTVLDASGTELGTLTRSE